MGLQEISNGILRGRLNVRGFKQINGQHYGASRIHVLVTNATTIRIVVTLMVMSNMKAEVVDVTGVF